MATIETFLGWNNTADGYLVGVGNLGSALLGYQGFKDYGLNIIAAFDVDERKVGTEIHETRILHVSKLPSMIRRMGIKIGILTVPVQSAQFLADIMIKAASALSGLFPDEAQRASARHHTARKPRSVAGRALEKARRGNAGEGIDREAMLWKHYGSSKGSAT